MPLSVAEPSFPNNSFPLSTSQSRLWFLHQFHHTGINNTVLWIKLVGNLDIEQWEKSMQAVITRHEAMRTKFIVVNGTPRQIFEDTMPINLTHYEVNRSDQQKNLAYVDENIKLEALRAFDLQKSPLYSAFLYELPGKVYYFGWIFDHLISDGISLKLVTRDLETAYTRICNGELPVFTQSTHGYTDYITWEQSRTDAEMQTENNYWLEKLKEIPTKLDFPGKKRPTQQTFIGMNIFSTVESRTHDAIVSFCKEKSITPFIYFASLYALLIYRYSGQPDFAVGMPLANRNKLEFLSTVGFFVNSFVLRCQPNASMTYTNFLAQIRNDCFEAYDHANYPFEKIVEQLQIERDNTRSPIFQFFLNTRPAKRYFNLPGNIIVEVLPPPPHGSNFDMTLYLQENEGQFDLEYAFNPDILSRESMQIFSEQLLLLAEQTVENPDQPILSYILIPHQQRHLLPNPSQKLDVSIYPVVPELFLNTANRHAKQNAIFWRGNSYSYERLAKDSQAIAFMLRNIGIQNEQVIALSGGSSYGLVSTFLGILQAGAAVLFIDPTLPDQRKRLMLEDANARLLFYDNDESDTSLNYALQKEPYNPQTGELVNIDDALLSPCPLPAISPHGLAYITYTSGTTGKPKGIRGIHNGLSHFLLWQQQQFDIGPQDHFAQITNIGFDVVFRDILQPLVSGAVLHCPPNRELLASSNLFTWFLEEKITVLHTVPSLARFWMSIHAKPDQTIPLRLTFSAGEKLTSEDCLVWKSTFSGQIINLYGPSETTLATAFYPADDVSHIQPIGKAIPGTQVFILNSAMHPAGIGELGQIVIRSPYRSGGYLHAKQQSSFITNPFTHDPEDILYLTGDLGRIQPDGNIGFIGRMDQQVKILGNRIEPEEINTILIHHPLIDNAYVQAVTLPDQQWPVLAAYIVPKSEKAISVIQIREYLQQYLSPVAIPQWITLLPELPLNPNGKIDVARLPAVTQVDKTDISISIHPPRNDIEKQLYKLWQNALHLDQFDIHANFFHLGGHSLLALSLCAQIEETMLKKISIHTFFRYPSIAQLSAYFENPTSNAENPMLPLQTYGKKMPLFCANMRDGSASIYRLLVPYLSPEQPVYGLPFVLENPSELAQFTSIEKIAASHVRTLLEYDAVGPYAICGYSFGGMIAFEIARQLERQGKQIAFLGIIDTWLEKYEGAVSQLKPFQRVSYYIQKALRVIEFHWEQLKPLPVAAKIQYVTSRIFKKDRNNIFFSERNLFLDEVIDGHYESISDWLKKIMLHYQPSPIHSAITLFRAETPSNAFHAFPNTFGWHFYTTHPLNVCIIPGSHYSIVQGNEIHFLGEEMQKALNQHRINEHG